MCVRARASAHQCPCPCLTSLSPLLLTPRFNLTLPFHPPLPGGGMCICGDIAATPTDVALADVPAGTSEWSRVCPSDHYMSGVNANFDAATWDRTWEFTCSSTPDKGIALTDCRDSVCDEHCRLLLDCLLFRCSGPLFSVRRVQHTHIKYRG